MEALIVIRDHDLLSRGDPEASSAAILPGGWLRTGDIGWMDAAGQLWLCGRQKDVVRTGGENVHATEVEAALSSHPAVLAAAVVGLPHARFGEQVSALVQLRQGWSSAPGDLHDDAEGSGTGSSYDAGNEAHPRTMQSTPRPGGSYSHPR
ncbi:hypothetical protein CYMTET_31399, partial [Cymbomonas tetramitiformis]